MTVRARWLERYVRDALSNADPDTLTLHPSYVAVWKIGQALSTFMHWLCESEPLAKHRSDRLQSFSLFAEMRSLLRLSLEAEA